MQTRRGGVGGRTEGREGQGWGEGRARYANEAPQQIKRLRSTIAATKLGTGHTNRPEPVTTPEKEEEEEEKGEEEEEEEEKKEENVR